MLYLPRSSYFSKPWKNGLGITEEIYVSPGPDNLFLFRVSMATLSSSGPFSEFPDVDRSLILLEGEPIKLNGKVLPILTPVNFPGEEIIEAEVSAKGMDLNLMCRRGKVTGSIRVLSGEVSESVDSDVSLVFALTDNLSVGNFKLRKYDSCLLDKSEAGTRILAQKFIRIDIFYVN